MDEIRFAIELEEVSQKLSNLQAQQAGLEVNDSVVLGSDELTESNVRFWAGSSYAERNTAPFRVYQNGVAVASQFFMVDGCIIGNWEISKGGIVIEEGSSDEGGAYVISRTIGANGGYCEARIGTNVLPSSTGLRSPAYFENTLDNPGGTNIGFAIKADNSDNNIACAIYGGCISGLAVKSITVSESQIIERDVNAIFCMNPTEITITMPVLTKKDDGHILWIKNINGVNVIIKPGSDYQPIHADRGTLFTTSSPYSLQSNGDASVFIFKWGLKRSGYSDTGFWVQFKNPRDW